MSITAETAKAHAHDPAVLCCRAEAGITIEPANLEDPAIFDDLVDSGLLNLDGCLTIEEVLGAKLTKTCDSLCPLTNDVLDGVKAPTTPAEEKAEEEVRQKLNLKETEKVYKLVRLRYVDDQPNVLVTTYVPCRLFEHLSEVDFEKESLYQTFHKEGRDITSIQRKLDVILADETCADLLDVKNGDPLFYFHSTGYDESHTAIEYSIAKYRGDRNSFVFQLSNNVYYS